LISAEG